jgi:adiponectin receptor
MDPSDLLTMPVDLLYMPKNCAEQMEHFAKYVWDKGWRAMPHHALPSWLRDNEYLRSGHRPPLPSTKACLESLFRLHTETGNIWTHLIGAIFFLISMVVFMVAPHIKVDLKEKLIFLAYFLGAICCLMFSTLFHTFYCYSPSVSRMFSK